ncbi:MAG: phosphoserine transaminase [Pseudomonadota bacterium]|nr:phosphoserine transaminase [Pseudomonadota bacterium]
MNAKPFNKPVNPSFSSGPCPKHPDWNVTKLKDALVGRSHRSPQGKEKLRQAINLTKKILHVPDGYLLGIVPASDTGAMEMALWNLLGPRPVEVLAWESFGNEWVQDIVKALKIENTRSVIAGYGKLPRLDDISFESDVVFVWNGTTSGVKLPNGDWISDDRKGLTICDATSAAFAMPLPWEKLDVTTFSWQKVLGGEAAHGVIVISPKAIARLEQYEPPWPLPKIFRLSSDGKLNKPLFEGATINTPSLLCVEDYLLALEWAERIGGLASLWQRADSNLEVISTWVNSTPWIDFLAENEAYRSNTSICLKITAEWFSKQELGRQREITKYMAQILEKEQVAFDIESYRNAPPGLRIWGGATVEASDIQLLLPWLEWAYFECQGKFSGQKINRP